MVVGASVGAIDLRVTSARIGPTPFVVKTGRRNSVPLSCQINAQRREYKLTSQRKVGQSLFAAVLLIGAGFFFEQAFEPLVREFALAVGAIFLAPGILILLHVWRVRLILDGDVIELRSAFRVHRAVRDEIEGLRTIQNQYGGWTRVYLRQDRGAFNVSDSFTGDVDLKEWFKGIPDLDQRDADEIERAASCQDAPVLLASKRSKAKGWAIGVSIFSGALSAPVMWVSYEPVRRAALALLLACTPAAIILCHRFPLLFTAFRRKPDPRADLSFLLFWPAIGVLWSYQMENDPSHVVDIWPLLPWVLIVLTGLAATLLQIIWKTPSRVGTFFFFVLIGGVYSIGLVNAVNTLPDNSPSLYQTTILEMHKRRSSKGTRYYLRVAPWGPLLYQDDMAVPRRTYDASHVGDPVCVALHSGVLRARWYTSMPCAARNAPAIP